MTPASTMLRARLPSLPLRELPAALRALGYLPSDPNYRAPSWGGWEPDAVRVDPYQQAAEIRRAVDSIRGAGAHATQEQIDDLAQRLGIPLARRPK